MNIFLYLFIREFSLGLIFFMEVVVEGYEIIV